MLPGSPATSVLMREKAAIDGSLVASIERLAETLDHPEGAEAEAAFDRYRREISVLRHRIMGLAQKVEAAVTERTRARQAAELDVFAGDHELDRLKDLQSSLVHCQSRFATIQAGLGRLFARTPQPLFPPHLPEGDPNAMMIERLAQSVLMLDNYANRELQHPEMAEYGGFADIRLSPVSFIESAHAAYRVGLAQGRSRDMSFLDVGCGGGVKVLMATHYFEQCDGLELDPGYHESACNLFSAFSDTGCRAFEEDALASERYADYDVVYFFQPMRNQEKLEQLERRICSTVATGTILIAPYRSFLARAEGLGCAHVDGSILVAGIDAEEAAALRIEAEKIGIEIASRRRKIPWEAMWTPLVDACLDHGIAV